jgi:hypothetical protein
VNSLGKQLLTYDGDDKECPGELDNEGDKNGIEMNKVVDNDDNVKE